MSKMRWLQISDENENRARKLTWKSQTVTDLAQVAKGQWSHMTLGEPYAEFQKDRTCAIEQQRFERIAATVLSPKKKEKAAPQERSKAQLASRYMDLVAPDQRQDERGVLAQELPQSAAVKRSEPQPLPTLPLPAPAQQSAHRQEAIQLAALPPQRAVPSTPPRGPPSLPSSRAMSSPDLRADSDFGGNGTSQGGLRPHIHLAVKRDTGYRGDRRGGTFTLG